MDERKLKKTKSELRSNLEDIARLEGKFAAQLDRLKEQFGINSLEEAATILEETREQIDKATQELEIALAKVREHDE